MRQRTSIIWEISSEKFKNIVSDSNSLADILRYFDLVLASGNYRTLKRRLKEEDIDYSHIKLGINSNRGRFFSNRGKPLEEVMIENSTYQRGHLKRRLLKEDLIKNQCILCGMDPIWNNEKLVMVLDHINGVPDDHRRENLRLLCPNCNSQQKTFAGRKKHQTLR